MKTKKWYIKAVSLIAVLALTVAVLGGCGNQVNDKDEQGRTILGVSEWPAEGKWLDIANEGKAAFEAKNPDVVVEGNSWTFDRQTFYAQAEGGQIPTLYRIGFTEVPEVIASEYSSDMAKAMEKYGVKDKFNQKVLDTVSKDGAVYAYPISAYVLGMAYNTELYKAAGLMEEDGTPKAPKDWYEVAEFAVKIKEATGKPGIIFPSAAKNGGWIFMPVAWSFGAEFVEKAEDGSWKAAFDTKECVEALQYLKDLKWKYDVLPPAGIIDSTEYYKTFAVGNAGMMITSADCPRMYAQYEMPIEKIGMFGMPAGPKRHVTLMGGGAWAVNNVATEDQVDAGVRWLLTKNSYELTEEYKQGKITDFQQRLEGGQLIGIEEFSTWNQDAEAQKWLDETRASYANSNPNYYKLFNEFQRNCPAEIKPEVPVCAQELYEILDSCIQEVFTNKDADCAAIIKKAAYDYQVNYLDNL